MLRESKGITQQQLSEKAGCSKNYLSAVERGVNKLTVPLLLEYCDALRISPNDVLGYTSDSIGDELTASIRALDEEQKIRALKILAALQ